MLEKHLKQAIAALKPNLMKLFEDRYIRKLVMDAKLLEIREGKGKILILADYVPIAEIIIGDKDFFLEKKIKGVK